MLAATESLRRIKGMFAGRPMVSRDSCMQLLYTNSRAYLAREGFPGNAAISPGRRRAWSADPWAQSIRRDISPTMRLYLATVTVCDASSVRRWLASRRNVSTVCGAVAGR